MPYPIRLLLVIPHLGGGGAEKVISHLAQYLSRDKYQLHLALVTEKGPVGHGLPPDVEVYPLGARRVRHAAARLLKLVWRVRPNVILSGMAHLNFLVLLLRALFPPGTRVLVRQNGSISTSTAIPGRPRLTALLYRLLYRRADRVICQSLAMAEDLWKETGLSREQIVVLPNPIDTGRINQATKEQSQWSGDGPHILAVGRLSPEKGFDMLFESLAIVRRNYPHADLILAGSGPEEANLKSQCKTLGIEDWVRFTGRIDPPYALFRDATVFVLPSRQEGMPNALIEAMVGGLPLVAMPCSGGVVELLRAVPGAWLADEISSGALAASLMHALARIEPGKRFDRSSVGVCATVDATPESGSGEIAGAQSQFQFARAVEYYEALIDATCAVPLSDAPRLA